MRGARCDIGVQIYFWQKCRWTTPKQNNWPWDWPYYAFATPALRTFIAGPCRDRLRDFSDVNVVSTRGEISWNATSRISDDEMRAFMLQVVDRLYTSLLRLNDPEFVARVTEYARKATTGWNEPHHLADWFTGKYNEPRT